MAEPRKVIQEQNPEASAAATEEVVQEIREAGRTVLPPSTRRPRPAGDAASASGELVNLSEIDQGTQNLIGGAALAVPTVADLRRVGPDFRVDRQLRLVEDTGYIYRFDTSDTTSPDDGIDVIAPSGGVPDGRWLRVPTRGVADGYASLDATGRLPDTQLPLSGLEQLSTGRVEFSGFTRLGGLNLRIGSGRGYKKLGPPVDPAPAVVLTVTWPDTDIVLPDDAFAAIAIDGAGSVVTLTSPFDTTNFIILGVVRTAGGAIEFVSLRDVDLVQPISDIDSYLGRIIGGALVTGMLVSVHSPPSLQVAVDSGQYYLAKDFKTAPASGGPVTFVLWHRNPTGWTALPGQTAFDPDNWLDDGSGVLQPVSPAQWTKPLIFAAPITNTAVEYHVVAAQESFGTQAEAELGNIPVPPGEFATHALRLAGIVIQQGATAITSIVQAHPRLASNAPPSTSVTDHGFLIGLGDDDHPQYQTRAEKGAASGYAGLNASSRLLFANFPIDFHREVNGNNEVSTSGAGFATVSGMTITPVAGTYQVFFTGNARTDTASRPTELGIAVAGGALAYSTRCVPLTEYTPFACSAFVTVDGAQAITGVFRRDTGPPGPNAFVRERQMSLRRVS